VVRKLEQLDTRRILKRLAKENLKQLGRMVAKIAHANPMTVLRTIVHQVLESTMCLFYKMLAIRSKRGQRITSFLDFEVEKGEYSDFVPFSEH
jgi:hypothetical protein